MLLPILFTVVFIVASVPVVVAPLRRHVSTRSESPPSDGTSSEPSRYEAALLALRDLELDHQLGVVNEDDYGTLHELLLAEAAGSLESASRLPGDEAEAAIEAAVRQRREQRAQRDVRFCPQCGDAVRGGDRFCTGCGSPLAQSGRGQR